MAAAAIQKALISTDGVNVLDVDDLTNRLSAANIKECYKELDRLKGIYQQGYIKAYSFEYSEAVKILNRVFDGLDEVPEHLREKIRRAVSAYQKAYALPRMIVTCRIRSYRGTAEQPGFKSFTLAPFTEEQAKNFCSAWYDAQTRLGKITAEFAKEQAQIGYRYADGNIYALTSTDQTESEEGRSLIKVPVKLREEIIGYFKIRTAKTNAEKSSPDMELIEAVAERTAIAMENARLVLDSQRRASKEKMIGEISSKIGASMRMDTIIQTTVRELGEALNDTEVRFRTIKTQEKQPAEKR
jgi:hypothetical protein